MNEEPKVPQIPDPAGESAPEEVTRPGREPAPEMKLPSFDAEFPDDLTSVEPVPSLAEDSVSVPDQDAGGTGAEQDEKTGTGNLLNRVTGSLRRVSGSLRRLTRETRQAEDAPDWMAEIRQEAGEEQDQPDLSPDAPTGEKRRSVTGQLFSLITGKLPGSEETPEGETPGERGAAGRPVKRRPTADESYISEMRQNLASGEAEQESKRGSGSLIQRFTKSLRKITSPLQRPDTQSADAEKSAVAQPFDSLQPEIEDSFLSGRLGAPSLESDTVYELGPGDLSYTDFDDLEAYSGYDDAAEAETTHCLILK
jgi:hypothetical protein